MENELNCAKYGLLEISTDQLSNCYLHPNFDTSIDQNDPYASALSSIVSSPIASSNGVGIGDGMMIRELIGRLGSICDDSGGEITLSPPTVNTNNNNSTNTSCYSTPLNSPPSKFNLSSLIGGNNGNFANYPIQQNFGSFNCDPGFVERAAKFSCFGGGVAGGNAGNLAEFGGANSNSNNNNGAILRSVGKLENGRLSRVNSEKKLGENGDSREGSSISGVEIGAKPQNDVNSRKRKSVSKPKVKNSSKDDKVDVENEELLNAKRSKKEEKEAKNENIEENREECNNNKEKENNNNNSYNKEASKAEPPKDYIHVRARRGQATDSHSLAERVRREKISERMKFLQDLVPGCNKVTGKATILDEIINYVQSLQKQVEFLSMKLATVNPRMEFNMEALFSKDMLQSRGSTLPQAMYQIDQNSLQVFPFAYQPTQQISLPLPNGASNGTENHLSTNPLNGTGIQRHLGIPVSSIDGFMDSMTQLPTLWEDDLQSLVQMGIVQNQTQHVPPSGTILNGQMKVEL